MLIRAVAALLIAACSAQANPQAVLDRAVQALGGADALQKIEVVRLQLEGETWPRLQTRTPEPPFEAGKIELSLLLDLEQNRLLFSQHEIETGFVRDNTTLIKDGEGVTHHHGDHIGGLRSFVAEGATVITTAGTRKVVERLVAAPHADRLAAQPRSPEFCCSKRA